MDHPGNDNNERLERRSSSRKLVRTKSESASRRLRKRLNMLRDYQADTLTHRAGDVELAVETVIFEQLVRQSKNTRAESPAASDSLLHSVLENVQSAVSQLAQHRENDRQEHQQWLDQHAKLVALTESLSLNVSTAEIPVPQIDPAFQAEHERLRAELQAIKLEHEQLLSSISANHAETQRYSDQLRTLKHENDELRNSSTAEHTQHESVLKQLQSLQHEYDKLQTADDAHQSDQKHISEELRKLKLEHENLLTVLQLNKTENASIHEKLVQLRAECDKALASSEAHRSESATFAEELHKLKAERESLLASIETSRSQQKSSEDKLSNLQSDYDKLLASTSASQSDSATIAQELGRLKSERDSLIATIETNKSEQKATAEKLVGLQATYDALVTSSDTERSENKTLADERNSLKADRDNLAATIEANKVEQKSAAEKLIALQGEYDKLLAASSTSQSDRAADQSQIIATQVACQALEQQLAQRTNELTEAKIQNEALISKATESAKSSEFVSGMRDQLIQERQTVVELRMQISDLQAKLATIPVDSIPQQQLTWDQQKALLLKKLEGESELGLIDMEKSLEINSVIERTTQEVTKRDGEILELKRLLAEQSTASQSIAIGAAAVAEMLDHDDFIKEERDNLRVLQEQLQAKLREAEVEISLERAKIARQRMELEEKIKDCERGAAQTEEAKTASSGSKWRSRLGLGGGEQEGS